MDHEQHIDSVVLDAVREKIARMESDVTARQQEVEKTLVAYQNAQAALEQVQRDREKLQVYLAEHSARVPDSVLGGATVTIRPWMPMGGGKVLSSRSLKHEIIARVKAALADGSRMRSDEIHQYLTMAGMPLNFENGPRRITQILSESGLFDPDRARGWGLKPEASSDGGQEAAEQQA